MTAPGCDRLSFDDLTDYAAGELSAADAAALEDHLFSCPDCARRAADLEALARAVPPAVRSAGVGGFVTDDVLNRLARDGVRVRTFTLSPGALVPCAVWDDDELMAVRLRGDFGTEHELTLSERVGGTEVARETTPLPPDAHGDLIHVMPAAMVRHLPEVNIEITLSTHEDGVERTIGTYTLVHAGSLRR
jgi:hypothetical protein